MWPIVYPLLSGEEVQRFSKLKHVNTDIGRGQWVWFVNGCGHYYL